MTPSIPCAAQKMCPLESWGLQVEQVKKKKEKKLQVRRWQCSCIALHPNSCPCSLLCPWSKFKELESSSRGRKCSEKFAKIVTLWLTEGAQLPQERMQTLRVGMNLHCSWAYTVRYVRITQKSPSPSWSLSKSCAEITAPENPEFRLRGVAGEDRSCDRMQIL